MEIRTISLQLIYSTVNLATSELLLVNPYLEEAKSDVLHEFYGMIRKNVIREKMLNC